MNDMMLVNTGIRLLIEKLGNVDAEKFIALIIKEPFDYTKWHNSLFKGMSIEEISREAMELYEKTYPK